MEVYRKTAQLLSLLVVALGASVLLGWTFDVPTLKGVVPGLVTMKANTALGMMLGGAAMALLSCKNSRSKALRFYAIALAGIQIALGASTLGEYFFGWNLGIDQLLFRETIYEVETLQPGRMSPSSAFCFIMAGTALGVASRHISLRIRFPIMWALGATLIAIGGIGSVGQITNALLQVHLWNYFGMAVHTAIDFVLLGSGLLALVKSERGMTWALDKMTTTGFIISIVIFLTAAGVSWNYTNELKIAAAWVSHTHEVLKEIGDVRAGVAGLESSQRGYIILGDEAFLTPRKQVSEDIRQSMEKLRSLTTDNPHQKPNLDQLEPLVAQRTAFGEQTISVRREQGFPAAQRLIALGTGSELSASIERVLAAMRDEEESLLVTRKKAAANVSTATFLTLPVVVFLSLTTLSLALFFLNAGITERGLAQEVSMRLAAIVDSSNDAIVGKDSNSIVTSWNRGAERLFGYSAKEMIGRSITLLIPPDRQEEELQIIKQVKNGETVASFDTVRRTKDGRLIDIAVSVSPIKDKIGKIVGASKVARDITERKQAEKALQSERDFSSAVVDTVGSLVVVIDRQARIIRFNRYCEQLTGYSFAEVQGRNLIDLLIMPEEQKTTTAEFLNLCAGQFPNTFENHWVTKQGNPRVIAWSNTALLDAEGKVEYVIGTGTDVTERKRAMESLVESEDRLRFVTDNARVGLVIVDRDRRYTYANHAYADVLDLHESRIVGQRVSEVLPRIYEEQIRPQLDRAFAGERVAYELCKPETGGDRHFAIKYEPTKVEGEVTLVIVVVTDITEIKRAEEAQRTTEARYRTLFDYAPNGIVIADPESYYLDANASICKMLGYSRDELVGLHASDIVATAEIPHIAEAQDTIQARSDYHREWQFRRKDGSLFPAEVLATRMPDDNLLGVITDITVRKRAEETQRRQAAIIDLSPDAIIVRDLGGRIVSWSRGAEALYGWVEEEVLGQVTHSLFQTRFPEPLDKITEQFETTGRWSGELVHRTKDGRSVHVQSWWLAESNELGQRTGLLESNVDITERKRVEQEVHELNARLEERVAERTSELEAANKELEAFSYSVSHDLRAPLRAVDGFSQAVLEDYGGQLPEEGRRDLLTIREGAQRMGVLIDDLLRFSRLSRAPLNSQEVNASKLVRHVLEDLKSQQEKRQIEIRVGDLPSCFGDAGLLNQVWFNLISNALKYTRKCEAAVIEIGCTLEKGEHVYFVRDNGAGFDMRYVQKLFGVFQRLHRVDEFEGTGVGLAIVQRIIHRHGGRIWADAALKRGATFYFTLQESLNL